MLVLGIFAAAWMVGLSGALMPGPLLTITINESLHQGYRAGPLIVLGHGFLELVLVVTLLLGLQRLLLMPLVEFWLSLVGGLVLGWLSYDLLRVVKKPPATLPWAEVEAVATPVPKQWTGPVWRGIITSVANPYWALWWISIGAAMLSQAQTAGRLGVVAFFSGHILADLVWYAAVSAVVVSGRRWLNLKAYCWLIALCGLFLAVLAVYFLSHAALAGYALWKPG